MSDQTQGKWMIHYGDKYYPSCEIFETFPEARKAWEEQLAYRKKNNHIGYEGDYLVHIIDMGLPPENREEN